MNKIPMKTVTTMTKVNTKTMRTMRKRVRYHTHLKRLTKKLRRVRLWFQ